MYKKAHHKYLTDNIAKTYKQVSKSKVNRINFEARKTAIDDRIKQKLETETFITVTNHKESLPNSPSFTRINRLISEMGEISKHILDNTNESLLLKTKVNQWIQMS